MRERDGQEGTKRPRAALNAARGAVFQLQPPEPRVGLVLLDYTGLQQQTEAINKSKPITAGG